MENENKKTKLTGKQMLGITLGVTFTIGALVGGVIMYKVGINAGAAKFNQALCDSAHKYGYIRNVCTEGTDAIYVLSVGKKFGKSAIEAVLNKFNNGTALSKAGEESVEELSHFA